MIDKNIKGTILIILSACAFGLMPTLSKFSMREGLGVSNILALRFSIASLFIWGYIFIKKIPYKASRKHLRHLIVISVIGYVGTSASYFNALKYVSSYIAAILMYIYPTIIVVYELFYLKAEKDNKKLIALLISTIGIVLIVWSDNVNVSALGIILALASGFFYALYTIGLQEEKTKEMNSIAVTGYILVFSAISFLAQSLLTGTFSLPNTSKGYLYIVVFALVSSCFAIFAFATGVKMIGASKTAIISTMEPVFATFMGVYVFKEKLTIFTFLGGCLILIAIIILQMKKDFRLNLTRNTSHKNI